MLLCCLRCTLKPSASAIVISKLYQHFRVRDHPYGLQDSLPTLNPSCLLQNIMHLRHGSKARYGWVANPYRKSLLTSFPTGTFTLQDTPSFPRRDLAEVRGSQGFTDFNNNDKFQFYNNLPKRRGPGCHLNWLYLFYTTKMILPYYVTGFIATK